jgi:hypothetical protein
MEEQTEVFAYTEDKKVKEEQSFLASEIQECLHNNPHIKYYEPALQENGIHPQEIEDLQVVFDPKILQGRGESGHDVQAFQCAIKTPEGETSIPVVIKGYSRPVKAQQEFNNLRKVLEKGIPTTVPLALIIGKNSAYVVIQLDPDLRAADTIAWDVLGEKKNEELSVFFQKYASAVAQLHANGIFHGDAQPRNVNYSRNTSDLSIFDWETARIFMHNNNYKDPDFFISNASDDLCKALWGCCREKLFDQDLEKEEVLNQFKNIFLPHYINALSGFDSRYEEMQSSIEEVMMENFRLPGESA